MPLYFSEEKGEEEGLTESRRRKSINSLRTIFRAHNDHSSCLSQLAQENDIKSDSKIVQKHNM